MSQKLDPVTRRIEKLEAFDELEGLSRDIERYGPRRRPPAALSDFVPVLSYRCRER